MGYVIEIDENGTITLTLPDDTTRESKNINIILDIIREDHHKEPNKPDNGTLGDLFNL